jgi:Family of unknown function (DUF5677)
MGGFCLNVPPDEFPEVPLEQLVGFLSLSIDSSVRAAAAFRCDVADPRHRYAIMLLYALTDHARVTLTLAQAGVFTGIGPITRCAIDAYADLCNVCDHPRYFKHLDAASAFHWRRLLERASAGRIAALRGLTESELLPVGRKRFATELKALKAEGVEPLGIEERFERAKLTDEYQSLYAILSAEAHNNIAELQSRYVDGDQEDAWLVPPGQFSRGDHNYGRPCTLTMGEMIVKGTEKVLRLLGHGVAVISSAGRELERIAELTQAEETRRTRQHVGQTL